MSYGSVTKRANLKDLKIPEILKRFNINIGDEDIKDIDVMQLSNIECTILNRKTDTLYHAILTSNIQNHYSCGIKYVKTRAMYNNGIIRETYRHLATGVVPIESLAIVNDNYVLVLERLFDEDNVINSIFPSSSNKFNIRLLRKISDTKEPFDFNIRYKDYEQVYASILSENTIKVFEQTYLGDSRNPSRDKFFVDKYDYIFDDNLIHGVQRTCVKDVYDYSAICMEKSLYGDLSLARDYEPYNFQISSWGTDNVIDKEVLSCFNYWITLGPLEDSRTHLFLILKYKDGYKIIHRFTIQKRELVFENITPQEEFFMPTSNESIVNDNDLILLISKMKEIVSNEIISRIIVQDLEEYRFNLKLRNKEIIDIISALNPRLYIRQSFDDILSGVRGSNIDFINEIFKQIEALKAKMNFEQPKALTLKK